MKDNRKNIFLNDGTEKVLNDILLSKRAHMPSFFEQGSLISSLSQIKKQPTIKSSSISDAIQGKTVVKDDENNRILGITDDAIVEFDERIIKGVTLASQSILDNFRKRVENGSVIHENVAETLTYIEFTNAAFIDTPEFQEVKKELNRILANMMKSDDPIQIGIAREGILEFFEASKNNIVRGRKKFKNIPYSIENSKEKELFRTVFIAEMFDDGVFDFRFLEMSGEIDEMNFDTIDSIYRKSELFTPEQVSQALLISGCFKSRDEILEYYINKDKRYFVDFATIDEVAEYIINGKITPREASKKIKIDIIKDLPPELLEEFLCIVNFPKNTEFIEYVQNGSRKERILSKKLLSKLDRESFLKVVLSERVAEKIGNPYTSDDYIDEYGKLSIDDIMILEENGKIEEADLIKLVRFQCLQVQDPEEYNSMITTLLDYYDLNRLESLIRNKKINPRFTELYNKLITKFVTEEQKQAYFEKINKDLAEKENSDETVTSILVSGLDIGKNIDFEISEDYIIQEYLEERLQEDDLLKMYKDGLISLKTIRILYTDPELIERYKKGIIDYRILNTLENRSEIIREELQSKRLKAQELMDLYSKQDGIQIEEFTDIIEGYEMGEESLVDYLSDEVSPEKIQALFNKYYISQDDLSVLVERKLITAKQAEEFAAQLVTHEQYESIFNLDKRIIKLTRETEGGTGGGGERIGPGPKRPGQIKNDPELQELLLSQIGFDERTLVLEGINNSLNGYKVFLSEEYEIMVFLKNDKPGNATYAMSLQQGLYLLNKIVRERSVKSGETELTEELQSDATKRELRETEHVKVMNASAGWGANIVDAMKKLSAKFREKIREQTEYKKVIDDVIEEIRTDYKARKDRDE